MAQVQKKENKSKAGPKKEIVNEALFGKSIDYSNPKAGISASKIQSKEVGNIPGTIEHWGHDVEARKKEILKVAKRSFIQRAAGILGKSNLQGTVTGEELLKYSRTQTNEELVSRLKGNPADAFTRLQLVSSVGKNAKEAPIEMYRALLLQSMVACSLGELSTQGLKITIWAQSQYFLKLYNFCKDGVDRLNKTLTGAHVLKGGDAQKASIEKQLQEVQRNINILRLYQSHTSKIPETGGDCTVTMKEIKNFYLDLEGKKHSDDEKKKMVKKITAIVSMIRYIILLHPIAHEILDLFIKMDNNNPVGHFLKGRINMSAMTFSVSRFEGGDKSKKTRKEIQDRFKDAYHDYGVAVKRVGTNPKGTTQDTILIEYAQSIYYFYMTARNLLGITLPKEWVRSALTSANKTLQSISDPKKVGPFQKKIQKLMEQEGCKLTS